MHDPTGDARKVERDRCLLQRPGEKRRRWLVGADADKNSRAEAEQQRMQAQGEICLRGGPAGLPANIRQHGSNHAVADSDQHPDGRGCDRGRYRIRNALCAFRKLHFGRIDRLRHDDAIGMALLQIARSLEQPCRSRIRFVIPAQKDVQKLGAAVAFRFGENARLRNILRGHDRADRVRVFDRKVGHCGNCVFDAGGLCRDDRISQPVRQDPVAAAIGVQDRFEGKVLLRPALRMGPYKLKIADVAAAEQSADFLDVLAGMCRKARENFRIARG